MAEISVIIHTKNNEKTLQRAIKSVVLWASEVLVVDMHSEDGTVELARGLGAKIMKVQDYGYVEPARNEAIEKAQGPWILILDADEEIPQQLAEGLKQLAQTAQAAPAYYIPRKNMIFGKWAKTGWWPDYLPRFFQKGAVDWPPTLHAAPVVHGTAEYLEPKEEYAIIHHNYDTVEQFVERLNRYTSIAAERTSKDEIHVLRAGYEEFVRRFYEKKGYEDGTYGLNLALLQFCYETIAEMKRWEKAGMPNDQQGELVEDELDRMYQHLCYWIADKHVKTERSPLARLYWRVRRKLMV